MPLHSVPSAPLPSKFMADALVTLTTERVLCHVAPRRADRQSAQGATQS